MSKAALMAARPIIEETMRLEIESYARPETKDRPGSIKGTWGRTFYNPDTIDTRAALDSIRQCQEALTLIDAALAEMKETTS